MRIAKRVYDILTICLLVLVMTTFPAFSQDKTPTKSDSGKAKPAISDKKSETKVTAPSADPNQKVATVNGVSIVRKDLDKALKGMQMKQGMKGAPNQMDTKQMEAEALDNAVILELLKQECTKKKIEASDAEVDEKIAQIRKNFPGDKEFNDMLTKVNLTQASLKEQLKQDTKIRKLIDTEVADKIQIKDDEIKAYYDSHPEAFKQPEQVKASHILVKTEAGDDDAKKAEAKKKITEIQQKLKDGGDFETLAKDYSDCPSKAKGGDLGFFPKEAMVKPFADVAFTLKPGEISDVVETQFGYHLIKVTDKKPEATQTYDEVKEKVGRYLKQTKVQADVMTYIEGLKKTAKIEKLI
ncbi:MAG TPA: peptidylprolyl isomerase [Desulfatirhabdiaceae bacterium]|nr:peptidylprolyl isomerase [Desulfatirhabdiaceae bacterium]